VAAFHSLLAHTTGQVLVSLLEERQEGNHVSTAYGQESQDYTEFLEQQPNHLNGYQGENQWP
jgi:hypothetical protein